MENLEITIFLDDVKKNDDGSVTIYWGYNNQFNEPINLAEEDSFLYLQHGEVIIQPRYVPRLLYPGKHHRFFCTIINHKTILIWNFMNKQYVIDCSLLQLESKLFRH